MNFGPEGDLVFRELGKTANYLARIKTDGTGMQRVLDRPIIGMNDSSPDGAWTIVAGHVVPGVTRAGGQGRGEDHSRHCDPQPPSTGHRSILDRADMTEDARLLPSMDVSAEMSGGRDRERGTYPGARAVNARRI